MNFFLQIKIIGILSFIVIENVECRRINKKEGENSKKKEKHKLVPEHRHHSIIKKKRNHG